MSKEITVIIPTYNEERNIIPCLRSIFNQNLQHVDKVIIADNYSKDKTIEISKNYDITIVKGGIPTVARNNGAKAAMTKYLLFIDADTKLTEDFFEKALTTFIRKKLKVATFYIKPDPVDSFNRFLFYFYNKISFIIAKLSLPIIITAGCCILVDKSVHDIIHGFSEKMRVLEEYEYIKQIKKHGKFNIIPIYVFTSTRRFLPGNRLKQTIILFIYYLKWLISGNIEKDFLGYWKEYGKTQ